MSDEHQDPISHEDRTRIEAWLRSQRAPAKLGDARRLSGGTQNVVIAVDIDGREVVLRRPPVHPRPASNASLRREMTVLSALAGSAVPHPRLLWACPDSTVLGRDVFYFMELVDGFNPSAESNPVYDGDPAKRHAAGLAVADALGRLANVDVEAVGLAGWGKPGFLERQVPRWLAVADAYSATAGYRSADLPHLVEVSAWLRENRPPDTPPAILHGDYQLANVLFHRTEPEVLAVVDWEMATVGDPLLDLGWLLVCWPGGNEQAIEQLPESLGASGGLADRAELLAAYAAVSGRDLDSVDWYVALAGFKLGILLDGTWARHLAGKADGATARRLHEAAIGLLEAAFRITSGRWSLRDAAL